jgi:agmatinase
LSLSEFFKESESGDIMILHAPIELSQTYSVSVAAGGQRVREHLYGSLKNKSASISPSDEVIIDLDLERQICLTDVRVKDLGDIIFYPEFESSSVIGKRTGKVIDSILSKGCHPVTLGGDHSITFYILEAVKIHKKKFGVIHFDAHHDFYTSGNAFGINDITVNHANVFHHISKIQEIQAIHQIGLRDIYRTSITSQSQNLGDRIHFVSCRNAEKDSIEKILGKIDPSIPYYITFDVDVLDSGQGDGTATPLLGGLSYWRAFELMKEILSAYEIIGLDFVEIGGKATSAYSTADFVARMVMLFVFSIRPTKPLSTYIYS